MHKPQRVFLEQLSTLIKTHNSVTLHRSEWCQVMNTTDKNINRKLTALAGDLCKVETSRTAEDVPLNHIRVTCSPAYFFIGTEQEREQHLIEWYVEIGLEGLDNLQDWFMSREYQSQF